MVKIHWFDGRSSYAPVSAAKGSATFRSGRHGLPGRVFGQSTVESAMAHHPGVKPAMLPYASTILGRAKANHTTARLSDAAFDRGPRTRVYLESGELDWGIHLEVDTSVDTGVEGAQGGSGLHAAMAVEFGHTGMGYGPVPFQIRSKRYPGKYILHRAAGIIPKGGFS